MPDLRFEDQRKRRDRPGRGSRETAEFVSLGNISRKLLPTFFLLSWGVQPSAKRCHVSEET